MKKILKDAFALLMITLVAGILLGFVYSITKEPIAQQEQLTKERSCQEVFADAATFENDTDDLEAAAAAMKAAGYEVQTLSEILVAKDDSGSTLGYVLSLVDPEGYGGDISFMMGIRLDGTLNGISILSIGETAGLGMNADTDAFKSQFANKKVEKFTFTKTGSTSDSEIDAISGATITTTAMTHGVNAGLAAFSSLGGEK